jgi:hypothetical protein
MRATDVVAYTYQADIYHPECVLALMADQGMTAPEGFDTEEALDYLAGHFFPSVDRYDEYSFDSDDFPKVVFSSQVEDTEWCGGCGDEVMA